MGGLALPIALGVMQAGSAYYQGRNQEAAYNAQAETEEANARNKDIERQNVNQQAALEARREQAKKMLISGANRAAGGAGGLTQESGTLLDYETANREAHNENMELLRSNLYNKDWGLRQEQANMLASASSYRSAAKSAKRAGILSAATSILSTALGIKGFSGASKAGSSASFDDYQSFYTSPFTDKSYGVTAKMHTFPNAKKLLTPWRLR